VSDGVTKQEMVNAMTALEAKHWPRRQTRAGRARHESAGLGVDCDRLELSEAAGEARIETWPRIPRVPPNSGPGPEFRGPEFRADPQLPDPVAPSHEKFAESPG
jgi:hypothetical protein